jgi:hypothetical protein
VLRFIFLLLVIDCQVLFSQPTGILICSDTTSSMELQINMVTGALKEIVNHLSTSGVAVGLMEYKDYSDKSEVGLIERRPYTDRLGEEDGNRQ